MFDNVLSRWTPRYLTDVLKGTLFPPMFAHSLSTDSRQDTEPTGITSVLSVFNLSLLLFFQSRTSSIHVFMWLTWARVQVVTADTVSLVGEKVTKPIEQIGTGNVWWERGGAGLARQFAGHSEELPAERTGVDLLTVEPSLGLPAEHTPSRQPAAWRRFPCGLWDGSLSTVAQPVSVSIEPPWSPRSSRGRKGGLSRVWWRTGRGGQELDEARHCRHQ